MAAVPGRADGIAFHDAKGANDTALTGGIDDPALLQMSAITHSPRRAIVPPWSPHLAAHLSRLEQPWADRWRSLWLDLADALRCTLRCAAQSPDPAVLQATAQDGSILPPKPSPTTQRQQVRGERADSKARKDAAMAKYTENMDTLGDAIGNT